MDHIVFIYHPPMDTWVASTFGQCEYAAVNIGVQISVWDPAFCSFGCVYTQELAYCSICLFCV